jgi:hypothetical protein
MTHPSEVSDQLDERLEEKADVEGKSRDSGRY